MKILLALLLLQRSFGFATSSSFCLNTLSRPVCPDLQTFDQFNITAYGGRWYEIGSNGYFKNVEEAGGTCVTADYNVVMNVTTSGSPNPKLSSTSLANSTTIGVVNSFSKQIGPIATSVVQGISLRAGEVCQQARQICKQTHIHGDLFRGLNMIDRLASKIVPNFSLEGDGLVKAKLRIDEGVEKINETLEFLSSNITELQLINANLSQAQGDQTLSVYTLTDLARQSSGSVDDIMDSVREISMARLQVAKIAGLLFGISNAETYLFGENSSVSTERSAVQLFKAAALIQSAEESLHGPLAVIKASLLGAAQSTSMLNVDPTGPSGPTPYLQGQVIPVTGNHSGRLVLNSFDLNSFYSIPQDVPAATADPNSMDPSKNNIKTWPSSTAGNYWILAAEGKPEKGYDAALVYGCQEYPAGGVKQPVFILSRQPTLNQTVLDKFFSIMEALGIDQQCAEPFVFSTQDDSCTYAPDPSS
ncbi:unnamed protein product [Calypogeia fissa]